MSEIDGFYDFSLSHEQLSLAQDLGQKWTFLDGPAGTGKTTAATARVLNLLGRGVPASSILLLLPGQTLGQPFLRLIHHPDFPAGRMVEVFTLGSLTRRMVQLFWPLVSLPAGFARPDLAPVFLNLETAGYFMAHLVQPLLDQGLFSSVHIDRNRLYSQIIDNLNKSALVGFPYEQIGTRLKDAWMGESAQLRVYEDVQTCASLFRAFCLSHNLVDYSLQVEIFTRYLWRLPLSRDYLRRSFTHLIYDNVEEDVPVAHDLITEWLPEFETALIVYDLNGGLRTFLGADAQNAETLKGFISHQVRFNHSWISSPAISALERRFAEQERFARVRSASGRAGLPPVTSYSDMQSPEVDPPADLEVNHQQFLSSLNYTFHRFFPQMLDWAADEISDLVHHQGIPAGEIAVLSPFLSDALRFSLSNRLQARNIAVRSHRPSRPLRDEPATRCLLSLTALAFPQWGFKPGKYEMVTAIMQAIAGLDLVRAQLLVDIVYREHQNPPELSSFERIKPDVRDRLSYRLGERFERLRGWLDSARQQPAELDFFLSRLFGELLSQPGFGFHRNYDAGRITAALIDSVRGFRQAIGPILAEEGKPLGREYLQMVRDGVLAAQNIRSPQVAAQDPALANQDAALANQDPALANQDAALANQDVALADQGAVMLAPAYTFLMFNRPVEVQFWLDLGSRGWAERVYQPLTHPYVLSRRWQSGRRWSDADEVLVQEQALYRLVLALLRRCRSRVYLGLSDLGESGYEQRGPLLRIFNRMLTG